MKMAAEPDALARVPPVERLTEPRLAREWKTMVAMMRCYCKGNHKPSASLCPECQELLDYAAVRLQRCRFGSDKPTCAKCPVHCYQTVRRDQVRLVMRYAGPRMLWKHPLLSLRHWLDSFRSSPATGRRTPTVREDV